MSRCLRLAPSLVSIPLPASGRRNLTFTNTAIKHTSQTHLDFVRIGTHDVRGLYCGSGSYTNICSCNYFHTNMCHEMYATQQRTVQRTLFRIFVPMFFRISTPSKKSLTWSLAARGKGRKREKYTSGFNGYPRWASCTALPESKNSHARANCPRMHTCGHTITLAHAHEARCSPRTGFSGYACCLPPALPFEPAHKPL